MSPLTFQTTFAPEIDLSSVLLVCNRIWRPETAPTSQPAQIPHETVAAVTVPKPPGQVTEISKGGYSLEDVLQWPDGQYTKVQKFVRSRAQMHLDTRQPFGKQKEERISRVCREVKDRFPFMCQYEDDWVTRDYLRMYLKNSTQNARLNKKQ